MNRRVGMITLDGEREVAFGEDDEVRIVLEPDAVRTVDAEACMDSAARHCLFRHDERRALDEPLSGSVRRGGEYDGVDKSTEDGWK